MKMKLLNKILFIASFPFLFCSCSGMINDSSVKGLLGVEEPREATSVSIWISANRPDFDFGDTGFVYFKAQKKSIEEFILSLKLIPAKSGKVFPMPIQISSNPEIEWWKPDLKTGEKFFRELGENGFISAVVNGNNVYIYKTGIIE